MSLSTSEALLGQVMTALKWEKKKEGKTEIRENGEGFYNAWTATWQEALRNRGPIHNLQHDGSEDTY